MKKKILGIIILAIFGLVTATTVYASSTMTILVDGQYDYDKANEVIRLTNEERKKAGLNVLEQDYELTKAANIRAREAALYFSHTRPNGESIDNMGHGSIGENLAAAGSKPNDVVIRWMKSDGHRENILYRTYKSMGAASYTTKDGLTMWVQIFSVKRASNTKTFTGQKSAQEEKVTIKNSLVKQLKINDIKPYTKIYPNYELQISKLSLRNEGWNAANPYINIKNATWSSSNTKVATISQSGKIKALAPGKTVIKAKVGLISTSVELTVKEKEIPIEEVKVNKKELSIYIDESETIEAEVLPSNTTEDKTISYTALNTGIISVDKNGKVTGLRKGSSQVAVQAGKKATYVKVKVKDREDDIIYITDLDARIPKTNLIVGETIKFNTTISPQNATEKVVYSSSNGKVVTVDKNGNIKAIGVGKARVSADSKKGGTSYEITVKEKPSQTQPVTPKEIPIESVKLNCTELTLAPGEEFRIEYETFPKNSTEKIGWVHWIGFDYRIVSLGAKGHIRAVSAGEGIIRVHIKNGVEASCKVKVVPTEEVKSITISNIYKFKVGEARSLEATIYPQKAAVYQYLEWTSSDPEIASINEYGLIFAHKKGTVTITVKAPNGVIGTRQLTIEAD